MKPNAIRLQELVFCIFTHSFLLPTSLKFSVYLHLWLCSFSRTPDVGPVVRTVPLHQLPPPWQLCPSGPRRRWLSPGRMSERTAGCAVRGCQRPSSPLLLRGRLLTAPSEMHPRPLQNSNGSCGPRNTRACSRAAPGVARRPSPRAAPASRTGPPNRAGD